MNARLFQLAIDQAFLLDLFGVLGLGLVALAAVRLARTHTGANVRLMTFGAVALLLGRLGALLRDPILASADRGGLGESGLMALLNLPVALLTLGLGAVVLGLWSHERQSDTSLADRA